MKIAASTEAENFTRVPAQDELKLDPGAAYVHFTTNNTIYGTQWHDAARRPATCRSSPTRRPTSSAGRSTSRSSALIYAGAQKNLGPSGVTLVIVREDLLAAHADVAADDAAVRGARGEQVALQHAAGVRDLHHAAGAEVAARSGRARRRSSSVNERKADKLYAEIDRTGFYRGHAAPDSRSRMNVTFRLPSEELEKKFAKEATAAGLDGLKGHRSVGGLRASIYNAFPEAGVDALVQFMQEFERKNG